MVAAALKLFFGTLKQAFRAVFKRAILGCISICFWLSPQNTKSQCFMLNLKNTAE